MKTKLKGARKPVTALVVAAKRNALKSRLSARGESIQQWLERVIDRELEKVQ